MGKTPSTLQTQDTKAAQPEKRQRIEIIDAARGFAIVLMVGHHLLYDLVAFFGAPWWFYSNPVIDTLRMFFIGVFMFVSGVSSRFSRGNIERGAIVFTIGVAISYITIRMGMPILFGILSVLGTLMMFYGITRKLWDKIPVRPAVALYVSLIVLSSLARHYWDFTSDNLIIRDVLFALGWPQEGLVTYDYETILPWVFVFLLGTRLGEPIKNGEFPKWFYEARFPFFPLVGRNALAIYVLHQPILYGLSMLVLYLMR